jgi:hypothetical protein
MGKILYTKGTAKEPTEKSQAESQPLGAQIGSVLETRRVPQVSRLRPGILLEKANLVQPKGQKRRSSAARFSRDLRTESFLHTALNTRRAQQMEHTHPRTGLPTTHPGKAIAAC